MTVELPVQIAPKALESLPKKDAINGIPISGQLYRTVDGRLERYVDGGWIDVAFEIRS